MLKFLSLTLLLVTACAPESMAPRADQREDSQNNTTASNTSNTNSMTGTGNVTTGAELYRTYCETCHGPEGTGAAVWSGNIQGIDPIHDIVKNGQGSMPPVPTTDQQTADIQAYLNSFNTPDPSTLTGIEAYANLCGSCHGSEGQGTASGPIIQFPVAGYAKWVTRNGRPGADYPGPMSAYGTDRLTDAQLDEIIDFLGAQTRPTTGQGLYDTLCANCHGADGRGGPVGKGIVGEESGGKIREGSGGSNYAARLVYMPSWTPAELSNEEIALIDAYVGGL